MWLIDSGNSQVKARWYDTALASSSSVVNASHDKVDQLFNPDFLDEKLPSVDFKAEQGLLTESHGYSAIGVNVAGPNAANKIEESLYKNGYNGSVRWLTSAHQYESPPFLLRHNDLISSSQPHLLMNSYTNAAQLGADRWVAAIAAFELLRQTNRYGGGAVIMHFGTASVIDTITPAGLFAGGIIFPGWHMMLSSLAQHTAQLPLIDRDLSNETPGTQNRGTGNTGTAETETGVYSSVQQVDKYSAPPFLGQAISGAEVSDKQSGDSLANFQAKQSLSLDETEWSKHLGPGLDTPQAMFNGCCAAHWGALKQQLLLYKQKFGTLPHVFITGGAFTVFNQWLGLLPSQPTAKKHLVQKVTFDQLQDLEISEIPDLVLKGVEYTLRT